MSFSDVPNQLPALTLMPDRMSWASSIGLFIINFGMLDLLVQDYLENQLSSDEFARFKERHFSYRIERIRKQVQRPGFQPASREQFEQWTSRLEPIRELRNHIAHGLLRASLAEDRKTWTVTISLPRDLDGSNSPCARHLTLEDLLKASKELTDLIEEFQAWVGNGVGDAESGL